jgi:hypothetical protein
MPQPQHRHDLAHRGMVPLNQLATGTPDGTKFLRDDQTLQPVTPATIGAMTNPMTAVGDLIVGAGAPIYYSQADGMFAYSNSSRAEDNFALSGPVGGHVHLLRGDGPDTVTWTLMGPCVLTFDLWYAGTGGTLAQDGTIVQTGLVGSSGHPTVTQTVPAGSHVYVLTSHAGGDGWGPGFNGITWTPTAGTPARLPYVADGMVLTGVAGEPAWATPAGGGASILRIFALGG